MPKLNCYGIRYQKLEACATCPWKRWCKDAASPTLLTDHMSSYDDAIKSTNLGTCPDADAAESSHPDPNRRTTYTREEVVKILQAVFQMDLTTIEVLHARLGLPFAPMIKVANKTRRCRQMIYVYLQRAMKKLPELAAIPGFLNEAKV